MNSTEFHTLDINKTLNQLKTSTKGLSEAEIQERRAQYGPNELIERGGKSPLLILWEQFTSTMVLILISAAVVSGLLGKTTETIAIASIVILFGLLGFLQEYRAEKAMAALKKLAVPVVKVRRGGKIAEISAQELVPGDFVLLEAGSAIPADLRLVESVNLRIQEAALTGESEPIDKVTDALAQRDLPLGDRLNMAYMGTNVTYGRGTGVVSATGMSTELGKIATLIQGVQSEMTPLQRQLDGVGKLLAGAGVVIALVVMGMGLLRGGNLDDMFLTAISVAVAVVPEGLPAVVTVTLALGAQRMLRRRALVRKLPAVETLGSVTVICSDKTGTLTENRMTVTVVDVAGHFIELQGTNPAPALVNKGNVLEAQPPTVRLTLAAGALCNDASLAPDPESGKFLPVGDPTEGALLVAAEEAGMTTESLKENYPRIAELPFDSDRKRMTTVHALPDDAQDMSYGLHLLSKLDVPSIAITKGAVDGLLELSTKLWVDDQIVPLDEEWITRIRDANDQMANNGMRVLGVAVQPIQQEAVANTGILEKELIFIGLVGMIDPPRPEVRDAVSVSRRAGIRPIMITGDHPLTARFIAHDLGITTNNRVKTGRDLDRMNDDEFSEAVSEVSVFARVSPEHKLRIVEQLQKQGQVVAMTGDGVNDSPALKKADIGIAMGITGTDVSKEAASIVLTDDNFATIVAAVEEGRVIFDNIRRFVKFSIAGNLGKVLVMLFAPLLGMQVGLLPLQLLWLNLMTDGLLGLGLGVEPAERDTMKLPPRDPKASFFGRRLNQHMLWVGTLIGLAALWVGALYLDPTDSTNIKWQTMMFTTLAFMQIGQALASRSSTTSFFKQKLGSNPTLVGMIVLVFVLQLVVLYVPALDTFFQIVPLTASDLALSIALGTLPLWAIEIEKWLLRRKQNTH